MKNLSNYITITVPDAALEKRESLAETLEKMTRTLGGVTITTGFGSWYDDSDQRMVDEPVQIFRWNFNDNVLSIARALSDDVVQELFAAGELSVFRERHYTVRAIETNDYPQSKVGYRAGELYP